LIFYLEWDNVTKGAGMLVEHWLRCETAM